MGNTVIWKPASSAMLSGYYILQAARGGGPAAGRHQLRARRRGADLEHPARFAGPGRHSLHRQHGVFQSMWKKVGENIGRYRSYPRLVGETGGKDFIVAHPSADVQELAVAIARGGFEYQGQKCSAASRIYVPKSLWPEVSDRVVAMMREMKMGDVADFRTLHGRGDRSQVVRRRSAATSRTRGRTRRSSRAAASTTRSATSSSRRWSRRRSPTTG